MMSAYTTVILRRFILGSGDVIMLIAHDVEEKKGCTVQALDPRH